MLARSLYRSRLTRHLTTPTLRLKTTPARGSIALFQDQLRSFAATSPAYSNMDAVKEQLQSAAEGVKNLTVSEQPEKAQKQVKKEKKKKGGDDGDARPLEMDPPPAYIAERNKIFDKVKAEYDAFVAAQPREDINVTLSSGDVRIGKSWETTPAEIARNISKSLFERTVIARVDGELWDLDRPLEKSCSLELLDFDHPEGKKVFWHSSAHVLGEASERRFGCSLCIGPPVDDGFYYEMSLPNNEPVQTSDWKPLEKIAEKIFKEKQPFERATLSKEQLLEMFAYNKYKQHIIKDKIPDGTSTTVYRCGPLIDLCRGPHIPHTGRIKAFAIMKVSTNCPLQYKTVANTCFRTPHLTSSVTQRTTRCSVSTVSRSQTRSRWRSISTCSRKPPSVTTARSERSRSSSSSTTCHLAHAFSSHTAWSSTTHYRPSSGKSTGTVATRRSCRQTCTTPRSGSNPVTGSITRMTCSLSTLRRTSGR